MRTFKIPLPMIMLIAMAGYAVMLAVGWVHPAPDQALMFAAFGITGQMTGAQARMVDPVLSEVARGYQNNAMVGHKLFPIVPVGQRGGKVIQFGKESFKLYATGRAPGANTKRVQFGYDGADFALKQDALEGVLPYENMEEASAGPGIDLSSGTVTGVQDIIQLGREYEQAAIARNAANYGASNKVTLSGTDQFSDPASTPGVVIKDAVESIRRQTGKRPNVAVIGASVFAALQENQTILDRIKYTGRDSITTAMLASLWGIGEVVVGDAIYDDNGTITDVWGNDIVLAFTQMASVANRGLPSYGYTYQLRGYPLVEQSYYDRSAKSWIYPVTEEAKPVLAGADAGFLIVDAV